MKRFLTIGCSLWWFSTYAQTQPRLRPDPNAFFKNYQEEKVLPKLHAYSGKEALSLYHVPLKKNDPVYIAKQDHLPCLIPEKILIPFIPNAWDNLDARTFRDNMPNPLKQENQ